MSKPQSQDDSYLGGTLAEMSARGGTTIPSSAGTQPTESSSARAEKLKIDPSFHFPGGSDNVVDMPNGPEDYQGYTGEVLTGTGHQLPVGAESKRVGSSYGGKHMGPGRHTYRSMHAREMGGSGPGYTAPH
ncbi:hypothetical protein K440DRAFT_632441 [Wilcoxina mikolae CBS 423.85]|nr:hypothetical protein K440DRAFT_632441 [Wilcoxina mikolae CBS 423.85]